VSPDYYRLVVAETQLDDKYRSLLSSAREQTGNENFDDAEDLVRQAQLIPTGDAGEAEKVMAAIADARRKAAEPDPVVVQQQKRDQIAERVQALSVEFEASLEDNRLVSPRDSNAQFFLEEIYRLDPDSDAYGNGANSLAAALARKAYEEVIAQEFVAAENWLAQAETLSRELDEVASARNDLEEAWAASEGSKPVPSTQLTIVSFVQPDYPGLALRRRVEGWVDVEFTVMADGNVADIEVIGSDKKGYFEESAVDAVEQWRFEPRSFRGRQIDQRVVSRLQFNTD
jgi:periplasmic protein TonB